MSTAIAANKRQSNNKKAKCVQDSNSNTFPLSSRVKLPFITASQLDDLLTWYLLDGAWFGFRNSYYNNSSVSRGKKYEMVHYIVPKFRFRQLMLEESALPDRKRKRSPLLEIANKSVKKAKEKFPGKKFQFLYFSGLLENSLKKSSSSSGKKAALDCARHIVASIKTAIRAFILDGDIDKAADKIMNVFYDEIIQRQSLEKLASNDQTLSQQQDIRLCLARAISDKASPEHAWFNEHLKRYLNMFLSHCPVDIVPTCQYGMDNLQVGLIAKKDMQVGEIIAGLSGIMCPLTHEEEVIVDRQNNFSVIISAKMKCATLLLGPARLINHDCHPNSDFYRISAQNNNIGIRVRRKIEQNEEITVFYSDHYFGTDNCDCLCRSCEKRRINGFSNKTKLPGGQDMHKKFIEAKQSQNVKIESRESLIDRKDNSSNESADMPDQKRTLRWKDPSANFNVRKIFDNQLDPNNQFKTLVKSTKHLFSKLQSNSSKVGNRSKPSSLTGMKDYCRQCQFIPLHYNHFPMRIHRLNNRKIVCDRCQLHSELFNADWPHRIEPNVLNQFKFQQEIEKQAAKQNVKPAHLMSGKAPGKSKRERVVFVDPDDTSVMPWWPALIVPRDKVPKNVEIRASDVAVRYFEDNFWSSVPRRFLRVFDPNSEPFKTFDKKLGSGFRSDPAVKRALRWFEEGKLPKGWEKYI